MREIEGRGFPTAFSFFRFIKKLGKNLKSLVLKYRGKHVSLIAEIHNDIEKGALRLITEYRARLISDAVHICENSSDAEDLVSRTLVKVINNLDSYKEDVNFYGWMKTIMVNLHANDLARPVDRGTIAVASDELERYAGADTRTEEQILANSDHDALLVAIRQLEPEYRRLVALYYFNGLSLKEIAAFLNSSTSSVSRKLEISRKILCSKLMTKLGRKPLAILATVLFGVGALFGAIQSGLLATIMPTAEVSAVLSAPGQAQAISQEQQESKQELAEHQQEEVNEMNQFEILAMSAALSDTAEDLKANADGGTLTIDRAKPRSRRRSAMKIAVLSASVLAASAGLADEISWTGTIDNDLSKPANWGVDILDGGDNATIGVNDQTFTLGNDVSFKSLSVTQKNATFDFSADPQKTISFAADGQFLPTVGSGALNFIGGIWDMKSGKFYATPQNSKTVATFDGAVVTNVGTFYWGEHSYDQVMTMKGRAVLHATTVENFATGARNILNVTDGSYFECVNFYTDYAGSPTEATGRNVVNVSGPGTVLKVTSLFKLGRDHYRNRLTVSDQATCSVKGLLMEKKEETIEATNATITISGLTVGSTSNLVEIVDCTATLNGTITLGSKYGQTLIRDSAVTIGTMTLSSSYETAVISNCTGSVVPPSISGGTSNLVEVADCAATVSGAITISGGSHGRVMVRNCGKSSCTAQISGGTDNEIAVCIVGDSKISATGTAVGSGNRIRLLTGSAVTNGLWLGESNKELTICGDGATGASFYNDGKVSFGASDKNGTKTNTWLRLGDGLQFQQTQSFYFGINDASGSTTSCGTGHDNVLYIGTNVVANFARIRAGNSGQRIIMDSGRLETADLGMDYGHHPDYPSSVTLIYRGTHPKLHYTSSNGYTMPGGNHLSQFDIPNEGYDSAPVQAKNAMKISDTSNIKVNVDPVAVSKAHGGERVLVPLATGSSLTISDEKLALLTSELGMKGARFVKRDKTLYLRIASSNGFMVLCR